jgi:hypothetical protein
MDRYSKSLHTRVSPAQFKIISTLAKAAGVTRCEYIRTLVQTAIEGTQPALTREELRHLSFISAGVDVLLTKLGGAEGQAAAQTTWNNNYAALTGTEAPPALILQQA